jgi:hypothetical protein
MFITLPLNPDMPRDMPKRKDSGCDVDSSMDNGTMWASLQMLWKTQKHYLDVFQGMERSLLPVLFGEKGINRILQSLHTEYDRARADNDRVGMGYEDDVPILPPSELNLVKAHLSTLLGAKIPDYMEEDGYRFPHSLQDFVPKEGSAIGSWLQELIHHTSVIGDQCRTATVDTYLSAYLPARCGIRGWTFRELVECDCATKNNLIILRRAHENWTLSLKSFRDSAERYRYSWRQAEKAYTGHDNCSMSGIACKHIMESQVSLDSGDDGMDGGEWEIQKRMIGSFAETSSTSESVQGKVSKQYVYWSEHNTPSTQSISPAWDSFILLPPRSIASSVIANVI